MRTSFLYLNPINKCIIIYLKKYNFESVFENCMILMIFLPQNMLELERVIVNIKTKIIIKKKGSAIKYLFLYKNEFYTVN